ncbi:hypothetical protein SO802_016743 [Lithocarpus litseifolius]|uniref:Uncharacterized protein n=1 Tax=Lithocarpus litseifolius TaxID=425828 RepID=A0AAW2CXC2_9ROSI
MAGHVNIVYEKKVFLLARLARWSYHTYYLIPKSYLISSSKRLVVFMLITLKKESLESSWALFIIVSAPFIASMCDCLSLERQVSALCLCCCPAECFHLMIVGQ